MNVNVIDCACLALLIVFLIIGAVRGIFSVILRFAATAAAAVGSRFAAGYAAPYLYTALVHQKVNEKLLSVFPSGSVGGSLDSLLESLRNALPEPAYDIAEFLKLLPSAGKFDTFLTVEQLEQTYVQPIVTKVLLIVTSVILFSLISLILLLIVNAIDKHFFKKKHSVLGTLNRIFGAIFSFVCGIIPVGAGCILLNLIAPVTNSEAFCALVRESIACSFLASIF